MKLAVPSPVWILLLAAAIVCFFGNHLVVITDPVESNYVLTAKEMLASGDYLSPRIFGAYWYDKPVLFYWELMAAFSVFGSTEFAARFFSALFGVISIGLAYWFAARIYDRKTGFITGLVLLTSLEYFYISKAVITDMTLFATFSASLIFFYIAYSENRPKWYYAAYVSAAIAVLTKGPVGFIQPGLIILVFLILRRDMNTLFFHMKLYSGIGLVLVLSGLWYIPMYWLHGSEFLIQFLGVHNFLRATVSEHPKFDVWYYYIVIFVLGWMPWVATLPLAVRHYQPARRFKVVWHRYGLRNVLTSLDMRQQFLLSWGLVVVLFYQCMATKYVTYTFPYMIPVAIGFASYLKDHEVMVQRVSAIMVAAYMLLTVFVAAPLCRDASAYSAAQVLQQTADPDACIVSYGGRYPVSLTYYSGFVAQCLKPAAELAAARPEGLSWNVKNRMPFLAIEAIPRNRNVFAVIHESERRSFETNVPGHWRFLYQCDEWMVYEQTASV
ncbi:glycosyltransferase family 39 protein [uncultured Megasphaera sp.]|uniref:ArnT family glycosyltransferase n=1 Tax=uncultured Megasphaera sp. TaxID=165188 RepID=UPI00265B20CA|nr:glycosyltransferase family 39 protein [uncultured Megasphaera sp.]